MSTIEEVETAAQQFNGYEIEGRALRVNAGPPPPKSESPFRALRSGGGGTSFDNNNKVYVGNLSWGVDDLALKTLLSEQGQVIEARVIYDRDSGRSKGFGFVTYNSADEVNNAIESLDGAVQVTFTMDVEYGKTYFLRIINAALGNQLFFAIAGHNMTVVEIDAVYTKPFTTRAIIIGPGQTTNVLVKADKSPNRYFMGARAFVDVPISADNQTATAILQYKGIPATVTPIFPQLPAQNDTKFVLDFNSKLRSLNTPQFPANVPIKIDRHLFYTISLGINACPTCQNRTKVAASLNNITFVMPKVGLLQAHYFNIPGVFSTDFPDNPPTPFNYTGAPLTANLVSTTGTRLSKLKFNSTVELVIQDTNLLGVESHPFHLHGFNFFVVGSGIGNFDQKKDPSSYNVVDPPERNTVAVPTGGWTAIRFRADNPGVWFFHCHLEVHTMWGLKTAFVVENGKSAEESILPPPKDLPTC